MSIKDEIKCAAVAAIECPSCGAKPGKPCHYIGHGGGLCRTRLVPTHQRRLSRFILDGHYGGLEECAAWLGARATELFQRRKTNEAVAMQQLADQMVEQLKPAMVKRAEEHATEFPYELPEDRHEPQRS